MGMCNNRAALPPRPCPPAIQCIAGGRAGPRGSVYTWYIHEVRICCFQKVLEMKVQFVQTTQDTTCACRVCRP